MSHQQEVEHLFRHEYGKLVALLVRRIDVQHIDIIEDSVQWAMAQALDFWPTQGIPERSAAWLYQVAYRHLISELRSIQRKATLLNEKVLVENDLTDNQYQITSVEIPLSGELSDSLLRMLFVACDEGIPLQSQLVFTLKSLCGFNIREVAHRLLITEANAYKRFNRAKQYLKKTNIKLDELSNIEMENRLASIHQVLYLIFTEGYLSLHPDTAIRLELCQEAIHLALLLINSTVGDVGESRALLALMYLHFARISARQGNAGELLLLEQQDRRLWNRQQISTGLTYLQQSTSSESISRYHIEAGIAAEHCLSQSFEQTDWKRIAASYQLLEQVAPSPMHLLNKAIAIAEWKGPIDALKVLQSAAVPGWFDCTYHWYAVKADLYFRCNNNSQGKKYAKLAIENAPTNHIKQLLTKRLLNK